MHHAFLARIAAIAVVLTAVVGLARATTPGCPSTHCQFLPLLGQGQAVLFPTVTSTATATPTATVTATETATPTASSCVIPDFLFRWISEAPYIWQAAGFTGSLMVYGTPNEQIQFQSRLAGDTVDCSVGILVAS